MSARPAKTLEPTTFLNVDLDVAGPARLLEPLAGELDRRLLCLHSEVTRGRWEGHFEARTRHRTVEATLRALLRVIEGLSESSKQGWLRASKRDFNIGIQAGRVPHSADWSLDPTTLARLAAVRGRVLITVYAPFPRPRAR